MEKFPKYATRDYWVDRLTLVTARFEQQQREIHRLLDERRALRELLIDIRGRLRQINALDDVAEIRPIVHALLIRLTDGKERL